MSQLVFPLAMIAFFGGLALLALALVGGLLSKSLGRGARPVALVAFALGLPATVAGVALGLKGREIEFALDESELIEITRRGGPLIHAIQTFTARTGNAPEGLDQLVPDYIHAIPNTGWSQYPSFEYTRYRDGKWKLFVETPKFFAWDEFVYDPNVTEPADAGCIDRVGDWYYLHE